MTERKRSRPSDYFRDWKEREALAEAMIPLVGKLSRENSVKTYIYGKCLVNQSVLDIMQDHRYVRTVEQNELSEKETFPAIDSGWNPVFWTVGGILGKFASGRVVAWLLTFPSDWVYLWCLFSQFPGHPGRVTPL